VLYNVVCYKNKNYMVKKLQTIFAGILLVFITLSIAISTGSIQTYAAASTAATGLVPDRSKLCGGSCPVTGENNVTASKSGVVGIIINVAQWLTFIGVGLSVLFMVWGGIRYITAGDGDGAEKGKKTLINAVIGLVVSIVAFTIVSVLSNLLQGNIGDGILTSTFILNSISK
jgi:hypothetical protein